MFKCTHRLTLIVTINKTHAKSHGQVSVCARSVDPVELNGHGSEREIARVRKKIQNHNEYRIDAMQTIILFFSTVTRWPVFLLFIERVFVAFNA